MAEQPQSSSREASSSLVNKLEAVLPEGFRFGVHHLSTPPFRTDALCSAVPNTRPDRTYCEKHLLSLSIDPSHPTRSSPPGNTATTDAPTAQVQVQVLVLALEVFIYTTAYSSIFFVSKADSTGYLHLLNLPKGTPSPIREISAAFIGYLVEHRRRDNVQSVVSLFARAQAQYLFPGSIENSGKHVLDDRGLVKWWCKVLNPLLEPRSLQNPLSSKRKPTWASVMGYLVIPGLDAYESRAFLPRTPSTTKNWVLGHPLEKISHFTQEYDWVPARCLIPRYPDDPKSRFRDELDGEASHWTEYREKGSWKSVKTLEQFWEMMAFRQECSGGHMTGFIWVVFDHPGTQRPSTPQPPLLTPGTSFDESQRSLTLPSTPPRRRANPSSSTPQSSPLKIGTPSNATQRTPQSQGSATTQARKKRKKKALGGSIQPRQPRAKTHAKNYLPNIPTSTAYYSWPPEGRGARIVNEADYKQSVELLLRLDFANLAIAKGSTKRWISEVGGGMRWGLDIVGKMPIPAANQAATAGRAQVNNMTSLVRKKRPAENGLDPTLSSDPRGPSAVSGEEAAVDTSSVPTQGAMTPGVSSTDVKILDTNLVREKRKVDKSDEELSVVGQAASQEGAASAEQPTQSGGQQVNVLGAGLVRKKPKVL